jgi:hypothetical protein|nr:hypothetical protein [Candidatus Krumholzibacteria bacterium]
MSIDSHIILTIQAAVTWALTGLIWMVQVVHYPLFATVGPESFSAYHARHSRQISYVVVPLMFVELGTAVVWLWVSPSSSLAWLGVGLLVLIWVSTFAWQVPQHRVLAQGFQEVAHGRLVATNWVRTVGWTMRAVLLLVVLLGQGRGAA